MKMNLFRIFSYFLMVVLISACTMNRAVQLTNEPGSYLSVTGNAEPGIETSILLEDGAGMVVPENSLEGPVTVLVERNPEKSTSLPPLPDRFVVLSDFYNYTVTSGKLIGPVDLVMPFDASFIPANEGELVMAIPQGDTWRFVSVETDGNMATAYTTEVGDPVIGWRYSDYGKDHSRLSCALGIELQVVQTGDEFEVVGRLKAPPTYPYDNADSLVKNVDVELTLNEGANSGITYHARSMEGGVFKVTLDSSGIKNGWNWIFAKADCRPEQNGLPAFGPSTGYVEFKYVAPSTATAVVALPIATATQQPQITTRLPATSTVVPVPIPAGAIKLPDFVGQPMDSAVEWLKQNKFGYIWVDGSSTYELGIIYRQAPAPGSWYVPHRTSVVLYRTVETITDPCLASWLTPEERANCGVHQYLETVTTTSHCDIFPVYSNRPSTREITFTETDVLFVSYGPAIKISPNYYVYDGSIPKSKIPRHIYAITFSSDGIVETYSYYASNGKLIDCLTTTYELVK